MYSRGSTSLRPMLVKFLKLALVMTTIGVITLIIGCSTHVIEVGSRVISKRFEEESFFYKDVVSVVGGEAVIIKEPWRDGADYVVTVSKHGADVDLYTDSRTYSYVMVGDLLDIVNSGQFNPDDTNNRRL